jgi:hypothetical protein
LYLIGLFRPLLLLVPWMRLTPLFYIPIPAFEVIRVLFAPGFLLALPAFALALGMFTVLLPRPSPVV